MGCIQPVRRVTQVVAAVALNANLGQSGALSRFCLPILNCQYCPSAWMGCPIAMAGTSLGAWQVPVLVLLVLLGSGVLFGRLLCGWVCPFGLLQDLLCRLPVPRFRLPSAGAWVKYGVLAVSVLLAAACLGTDASVFFCNVCPARVFQSDLVVGIADGWDVRRAATVIAVAIVIGAVLSRRSFCRALCPVGAAVALSARLSRMSLRVREDICVRCEACDRVCPMEIEVLKESASARNLQAHPECIGCLRCKSVCPVDAFRIHWSPAAPSVRAPCSRGSPPAP